MTFSDAATQQREREAQALKRFLSYCLIGSLGLHGVALFLKVNPNQSLDEPEEITIVVTQPLEPEVEPEPVPPEESVALEDVPEPVSSEPPSEPLSTTLLEEPIAPPPPSQSVAAPTAPVEATEEETVEEPTEDVLTETDSQPEPSAATVPTPDPNRRSVQDLLQNLRRNRQPARSTATERSGDSSNPSNATAATGNESTATAPASPGVITEPGTGSEEDGDSSEGGAASCRSCPQVNYPRSALEAGAEGRVRVIAETDEQGRVVGVTLIESSGNADLDQAVLEQVRREYEFDGAGAGAAIPIEVDMTIEGSDYNREAAERGQRTEVELPAQAAEEPSETPETAAESTEPDAPAATSIEPQLEPSLIPTPETDEQPQIIDSSPVPSSPASPPASETEAQPEVSDTPEVTEPEPLPELLDEPIEPEPPVEPEISEPLPESFLEEPLVEPEILPPPAEPEAYEPELAPEPALEVAPSSQPQS